MESSNINISAKSFISPDARIYPSVRGSRLVIGDYTLICITSVSNFAREIGEF